MHTDEQPKIVDEKVRFGYLEIDRLLVKTTKIYINDWATIGLD